MGVNDRYHGIDFMRASMMLMGIFLHAGVMYLPWPYGQDIEGIINDFRDPYRDVDAYSYSIQQIVFFIHLFRMPAFMLLAGFFGSMLVEKRGQYSFVINRCKRILFPLILFWFFLWPLDRLGWSFGANMLLDSEANNSVFANFANAVKLSLLPFLSERDPHTMHLWFIYQLLFFYFITLLIRSVIMKTLPDCFYIFKVQIEKICKSGFSLVFLFGAVFVSWLILKWGGTFHFNVSFRWMPDVAILTGYYWFFLCGWIGYHYKNVVEFCKKHAWKLALFSTISVCLHLYYLGSYVAIEIKGLAPDTLEGDSEMTKLLECITFMQALNVWGVTLSLVGLTEKMIPNGNRILTFLVGASYWLYLVHRPFCTISAAFLQRWETYGLIKYSVVVLLVTFLCLSTYHLFVRKTWVGIMLNGKKY